MEALRKVLSLDTARRDMAIGLSSKAASANSLTDLFQHSLIEVQGHHLGDYFLSTCRVISGRKPLRLARKAIFSWREVLQLCAQGFLLGRQRFELCAARSEALHARFKGLPPKHSSLRAKQKASMSEGKSFASKHAELYEQAFSLCAQGILLGKPSSGSPWPRKSMQARFCGHGKGR